MGDVQPRSYVGPLERSSLAVGDDAVRADVSVLAAVAAGRSQVYALLRDIVDALPTAWRLRNFERNPLLVAAVTDNSAGRQILSAIGRCLDGVEEDSPALERIAQERTRLLRGLAPGQGLPPACAFAYLPLGGGAADDPVAHSWASLRSLYVSAGFTPAAHAPPDALGTQIGFLAFLADREAALWRHSDLVSARRIVADQLSFLDSQLGRWIGPLRERVAAAPSSGFWPATLALLDHHLNQDRDLMRQLLGSATDDRAPSAATATGKEEGPQ